VKPLPGRYNVVGAFNIVGMLPFVYIGVTAIASAAPPSTTEMIVWGWVLALTGVALFVAGWGLALPKAWPWRITRTVLFLLAAALPLEVGWFAWEVASSLNAPVLFLVLATPAVLWAATLAVVAKCLGHYADAPLSYNAGSADPGAAGDRRGA
jgi:hypothetical protein